MCGRIVVERARDCACLTCRADFGLPRYAIDNGVFAKWNEARFRALLARQFDTRNRCLFVVVPDVVGSARRTLEVFEHWAPQLRQWPLALACQDGQEHLPIPWPWLRAVFIGGSTKWKTSQYAVEIIKAAQMLGKHVHVGRVNTADRADWCEQLGVNSIDGSGMSQYTHMRSAIKRRGKPLLDEAVA